MTIRNSFPDVRPALNLDFANTKRLDPRITFTRSSTGTYVDEFGVIKTAASNEARFDHDTSGNSLGLLIEESRTNLAENSEDFSLWTAQNSTVLTAQGTAPDGTNTAFKIQENTSTISHSIREPSNSTWSGASTLSCYVKPAGRNFAYMGFTGVSQTSITFDLVNKVSSYKGTNVTSGSVEDAGNGWLRIVAVFSSSITSGRATVGPAESDSLGGLNYTGDGSSGILAWGAQLEAGTFPTSYIPTSGSTATRSADLASMTGTNFSSWYNQNEGTMLSVSNNIPFGGGLWYFGPSTFAPRWWSRYELTNGIRTQAYDGSGGSGVVDITIPGVTGNATVPTLKHCVTIDNVAQEHAGSANGSTVVTGSWDPINGVSALQLGKRVDLGAINGYLNGTIARLTYYDRRLTDAQLQALTL